MVKGDYEGGGQVGVEDGHRVRGSAWDNGVVVCLMGEIRSRALRRAYG